MRESTLRFLSGTKKHQTHHTLDSYATCDVTQQPQIDGSRSVHERKRALDGPAGEGLKITFCNFLQPDGPDLPWKTEHVDRKTPRCRNGNDPRESGFRPSRVNSKGGFMPRIPPADQYVPNQERMMRETTTELRCSPANTPESCCV